MGNISLILNIVVPVVVVTVGMKYFIPFLHKLKFGQIEREEGVASHQAKTGTPTMGGIMFICATVVLVYLLNPSLIKDPYVNLITFAFFGYGLVGFLDDYLIVVKKNNEGLRPGQKFGLLSFITIVFLFLGNVYLPNFSTSIYIPLIHMNLNLSIFYYVFAFIMFTAETNAVNLTDGLDGLATGQSIIAIAPFLVFAIMKEETGVMYYAIILMASLFGFLLYNYHPAKVFMGDTGSLALGGFLASLAITTKQELLLILIGGVFLMETLSVMIQVISFKTRGKRVFKMAPVHHHFELSGWTETQVVITFWFVGFFLGIIGILLGVL